MSTLPVSDIDWHVSLLNFACWQNFIVCNTHSTYILNFEHELGAWHCKSKWVYTFFITKGLNQRQLV